MNLVTRARRENAEQLEVGEYDFKRNKELWAIKGLGRPIYCEFANQNRQNESEIEAKHAKTRCYKPTDLLPVDCQRINVITTQRPHRPQGGRVRQHDPHRGGLQVGDLHTPWTRKPARPRWPRTGQQTGRRSGQRPWRPWRP